MFKLKLIGIWLALSQILWATGLTFTFSNGVITGSGPKYYEFDVMLQADSAGTRLGDNQVYINYNTLGFGSLVAQNGKVTVEKGTLLLGDFGPPAPYYTIVNVTDNTSSRFAVTVEYNYPDSPEYGNEVPQTPTQLMHIKIEIADSNQTANLSFEQSLMEGQQFYSNNSTKYSPIIATDTDNSPLDDTPSAIDDMNQAIPAHFKLYSNFPNPFNPETSLKFDLPRFTKNVKLEIYDILGQKVATLVNRDLQAGRYTFKWSAENMPSGVYFAIFKAGEYTKAIKMMLVK